jgi:hypothetical protein
MLKLTVAVLAVVLAGTASAAGWRSLRIDASSEATFSESIATFQQKLTPSRRIAFVRSLQDIWLHGTTHAVGEYTEADYLRQVHGLGYEEVVNLVDPTGKKEGQYRAEYYYSRSGGVITNTGAPPAWSQQGPPPVSRGIGGGPTYRGSPVPNTADARQACGCMSPDNAPQ